MSDARRQFSSKKIANSLEGICQPPAISAASTALALSLLVTAIWLGAALVTFRLLKAEMGEVFDSALQETGQRILQLADGQAAKPEEHDDGPTFTEITLDVHPEEDTRAPFPASR